MKNVKLILSISIFVSKTRCKKFGKRLKPVITSHGTDLVGFKVDRIPNMDFQQCSCFSEFEYYSRSTAEPGFIVYLPVQVHIQVYTYFMQSFITNEYTHTYRAKSCMQIYKLVRCKCNCESCYYKRMTNKIVYNTVEVRLLNFHSESGHR